MTYELGALIGIGFIMVGNLVMVAYYGGRLTQKVDDHDRRIDDLEKEWNRGILSRGHQHGD